MAAILLNVRHRTQSSEADCLAACAAMVLEYIHRPIDYDQLLNLLQVRWFGAPSSNIQALTRLNVRVIYTEGTLEKLHDDLLNDRPSIAFVAAHELPYWDRHTQHAVVVVGLDDQYIYLNDPAFATSPIPVTHADFELAWLEQDRRYAILLPRP
jgi:ABC-type bacteriocin/lantibiotic exporter with double-glycine peptidase domain